VTDAWRLLALAPLDLDVWRLLFAEPPVEIVVPAERTAAAVEAELADAEIVVGDWSGLGLNAEQVSGARRLAFVQQPSVGVDSLDVDALAAAGVPVANAAGANAVSVA
jgi:D-3-phosphoglycerate dehydrogenase